MLRKAFVDLLALAVQFVCFFFILMTASLHLIFLSAAKLQPSTIVSQIDNF